MSEKKVLLSFGRYILEPVVVEVEVKVMLRPTASRPVCLGVKPHLRPKTRFLLLSDGCVFVDVGRLVWREDGSIVYNCCWPSPMQSFSGSSPAGLMTTFYWLRFEFLQPGGPGPSIYIPHKHGSPVTLPAIGFPFHRLLRLGGLRWRYSNPPPHALLRTGRRFTIKPSANSVRVLAMKMCELIASSDVMCQAR
jgi:hypothetical protein